MAFHMIHTMSMIQAGCTDGTVRVWRETFEQRRVPAETRTRFPFGFTSPTEETYNWRLSAAFVALPDIAMNEPRGRSTGKGP